MKTKAFQTKRKPKNGFRTLYAKTRKRKQKVTAAAAGGDFAVEEPNLGVARALVVILILHVAAIIAIVVHNSSNDSAIAGSDSPAVKPIEKANVVTRTKQAAQPKIGPADTYQYVQQGDTYERFARRHKVDVQELRRLNNSTPLKYGLALIVPAPAPSLVPNHQAPAAIVQTTAPDPIIQESLPPIVEVPTRQSFPTEYEVVEAAQPVFKPAAFPEIEPLPPVAPVELHQVATSLAVQPAPVEEVVQPVVQQAPPKPEPAPQPAMKSYSIRKGDTLWAIANRNGISVEKLMAANRNINPKKMKPGIKVKIPAR